MSFTPGPWEVGTDDFDNDGYVESAIKQSNSHLFIGVAVQTGPASRDQRVANARLIAAAPDMHEALEACKAFLEDMHTQPVEWTATESKRIHALACAALSRAKG